MCDKRMLIIDNNCIYNANASFSTCNLECVVLHGNLVKTICSLCCSMMKYDYKLRRGRGQREDLRPCMQLNNDAHSTDCHGRTLGIVLNIASVFGILYTRNGTFESNNAGVFRMRCLLWCLIFRSLFLMLWNFWMQES